MKTSSSKAKGHKLEALIRDKLIAKFGLTLEDVRIPIGSENGEDLKLSTKAKSLVPLVFEAKSRSRIAVYAYYDQAEQHRKQEALEPVVVIKMDRRKPLLIVDLDYFLDLLKRSK